MVENMMFGTELQCTVLAGFIKPKPSAPESLSKYPKIVELGVYSGVTSVL